MVLAYVACILMISVVQHVNVSIPISNAEPECLWDSEFTCGPVYPSTCADHDGEVGTPHCVEGCFCRPGYLRDVRGDCVEPTGCHFGEDCIYYKEDYTYIHLHPGDPF